MSVTTLGTAEFEKRVNSKKVVVVGGGYAGALVAKKLEKDAEVFLIDAKDFFEIPNVAERCIVEPKLAQKACFLHVDYLEKPTLITNSAKTATKSEVITDHGEHIGYDFLVIATENAYKGPLTREGRLEEMEKENKKLQAAKSVLIVGDGAAAVQLAGEVVTDFPEAKITLMHSGNRLLEFMRPGAGRKALAWLRGRGVEVVIEDKVEKVDKKGEACSYTSSKGVQIAADAFLAWPDKAPGTAWLRESEFKEQVDGEGRVKVDQSLRVQGYQNVFAVGDIIDVKEVKQGYFSEAHAWVTISNIKKLIRDPKCKNLCKYRPSRRCVTVVPLGRYAAISQTPCCVCSGRAAGAMRCSSNCVDRTRRLLGVS